MSNGSMTPINAEARALMRSALEREAEQAAVRRMAAVWAAELRIMYDAHKEAGFSDKQAFTAAMVMMELERYGED